ncbi:MAG TPA: hypothetical protein VM243_10635 [Phycisphaerae bacterium]|nr:hypothetical protein [Phycisphaerae bacterium]
MDTVKQSLAGIVGSMVLAGCLTDPNVVYVPQTEEEEPADEDANTNGSAAVWPIDVLTPGGDVQGEQPVRVGCCDGTLLAQSPALRAPQAPTLDRPMHCPARARTNAQSRPPPQSLCA